MLFCLVVAAFLAGCGKKEEKGVGSKLAANDAVVKVAQPEIPIYQYETDEFFDEGEVADFAFIEDDDQKAVSPEPGKKVTVENEVQSYNDWDDAELPLAWEDDAEEDFAFQTVNFDLNRNRIRNDQKQKVAQNIEVAKEAVKKGKKLIVAGHCCPLGSASYNMSLSERRAKAVRDEMVKKGIPSDEVKILGCGSECPIVLSDASDRSAKIRELGPNRRAEVSIH